MKFFGLILICLGSLQSLGVPCSNVHLEQALSFEASQGIARIATMRVSELLDQKVNIRITNLLRKYRIQYMGDLLSLSENEFLRIPSAGKQSLAELKGVLAEDGFFLQTRLASWPPEAIVKSMNLKVVEIDEAPNSKEFAERANIKYVGELVANWERIPFSQQRDIAKELSPFLDIENNLYLGWKRPYDHE